MHFPPSLVQTIIMTTLCIPNLSPFSLLVSTSQFPTLFHLHALQRGERGLLRCHFSHFCHLHFPLPTLFLHLQYIHDTALTYTRFAVAACFAHRVHVSAAAPLLLATPDLRRAPLAFGGAGTTRATRTRARHAALKRRAPAHFEQKTRRVYKDFATVAFAQFNAQRSRALRVARPRVFCALKRAAFSML